MEISSQLSIKGTNILIIGNRSYKNLGDELILAGTIKLLQQQGKKIYIQAYDSKWLKGFLKQFVDVSEITFLTEIPKGPRSIFNYIRSQKWTELWDYRKIDSVIVGGGEILTEENSNSYWYWIISLLPILIRNIVVKTNIYLMGGIQIPKKNLNLKLFNFILKYTTYIYARDTETVDEIYNYGYKKVSFFMDTAYFSWDWNDKNKRQTSKKYIVVNINKNGEKFIDEIANDVSYYANQGYHVYYVPVSKGINLEYDDKKYLTPLQQKTTNTKIEILDWENDFKTFVEVLDGAEIVISTRLHLFLIASFLGLKTKVYPYQKKILKMQNIIAKFDF